MKRLLSIIIITLFSSCNSERDCESKTDYTYYDTSNIRTKIIKDCNGNIREYHHYQLDCKNCGFSVFYTTDGRPDSISGNAWIHTFYEGKVNDFRIGDTLNITVEVANPPKLTSEFRIFDNDSNGKFKRLDSLSVRWVDDSLEPFPLKGTFYKYQTIINDTAEYFEMGNTYYFGGKPWITPRRHQPISVLF